MTEISLVLTTLPSPDLSQSISSTLVEEGLVACVNIIPGVTSLYKWEGKLCKTEEQVLLMKVTNNNLKSLEARLSSLHPYKVFEFIVLSPNSVAEPYLTWVLDSASKTLK